jgi:hypothetical protein
MAVGAAFRKVRFARFRIADQYLQLYSDGISAGRAALSSGGGQDAVDVLGDRYRVYLLEIDFRIMIGHGFADQFAMLIVESGPGAEKSGAVGSSAHVRRMTRSAVGFI